MTSPGKTVVICVLVSIIVQVLLIVLLPKVKELCQDNDYSSSILDYLCSTPTKKNSPKRHHFTEISFQQSSDESNEIVVQPGHCKDEKTDPAREQEALVALLAAKNFRDSGNFKKAKSIIEHALALVPGHPDILTEFGIVHEQENNFIEADLCYTKALVFDPSHTKALERRARTSPLVSNLDQRMLNNIRKKKDLFNTLPLSTALRRAMRESYFLYVYHTVAIEGNTLSLGQTRAILETGMAVDGKSISEHNEVIGMDSALRYLNHSLLAKNEISLEDILDVHLRVLGNVNPIDAGRMRNTQVFVGRFTPVSPEYVPQQMDGLIEWINSPEAQEIDPVEMAAIAHYKLVAIHPFVDGNGRTARLLMNLILMRAGFPPVILPVETRAMYYATLNTANLGDLRPFIRYVAQHADNTLQHYISSATPTTCGADCIESERIYEGDKLFN